MESARIESTRALHLGRLFERKTFEEVSETLPLVFGVCGVAQAHASALACRQALGQPLSGLHREHRGWRTDLETLREHGFKILSSWSGLVGEEPVLAGLKVLKGFPQLQTHHLEGTLDWEAAVQDAVSLFREAISPFIFGETPSRWLDRESASALREWIEARHTVASRLLARLLENDWDRLGSSSTAFLPVLEASALHDRLEEEDAGTFAAEPRWDGACHETGALARQVSNPMVQEGIAQRGLGVGARFLARLVELARLSLRPWRSSGEEASPSTTLSGREGQGLAQVEAARGRLIHRVEMGPDRRVQHYQIVAPTEWNFHPQGALLQDLEALEGPVLTVSEQAHFLVEALDPCVRSTITVNEVNLHA